MDRIVQKEALYCAVGRCARSLKNVIDFETALETNFIVEARETNPEYVHPRVPFTTTHLCAV